MSQQTPKKRVLFVRSPGLALLVVFGVFSCLFLGVRSPKIAHAATSSTINFQARLENASGSIAPDGNYNVEFKLYGGSSCDPTTGTGCTALWTEDYLYNGGTPDQRVRVANGYLSASLGSITAFPNTINWDQTLYISMNIGGSGTTASWDGAMLPYLKLTAVPYAFRAGSLATTNAAGTLTSTLSIQAPTNGSQTFVIQDQGAAGTYNLLTTNQANNSFIQLQAGSPPGTAQTGNFNISGTGIAGTLQAGTFDAATSGTLSIGSTNATSIALNQNVTVANGKTFTTNGSGFDASGNLGIGTTTPSANIDVQSSTTTGNAINITANSLTTGSALSVNTTAPTSGNVVNISENTSVTTQAITNSLLNVQRSATAGPSAGGVTYDNKTTFTSSGFVTSTSWNHTVGANANRVLVVALNCYISNSNCAGTTTVKYAGVTMTRIASVPAPGGATGSNQVLYSLTNPTTGTNAVTVTMAGSDVIQGFSESWYNVSQTTPITGITTSTTLTTSASLTVPFSAGGVAIDFLATCSSTATPGASQTLVGSATGGSQYTFSSYNTANGSMSWTISPSCAYAAQTGFLLNKVSTAGAALNGSVASFSSNCIAAGGSCNDTSNILSLSQQYSSATGAVAVLQNAGSGDMIDFLNGSGATVAKVDANGDITTTGTALIKTTATNALQVQNSSGYNLLTVDTSNDMVNIDNQAATGSTVARLNITSNWSDQAGDMAIINFGEGASTSLNSGQLRYDGQTNRTSFGALNPSGTFNSVLSFGYNTEGVTLESRGSTAGKGLSIINYNSAAGTIIKPGAGADRTDAVQFQNGAGASIMNIDTTGAGAVSVAGRFNVGSSSQFQVDASGNITSAGTISTTGSIATTGNNVVTYENLYSYGDGIGHTGTLELILPANTHNGLISSITIKGYDYTGTTGGWQAIVSGGNNSGIWYTTSAQLSGNAPFTSVRLVYDSTLGKPAILLGTTSTTWTLPQISVTQVVAASVLTGLGSGWSSAFLTTESGFTNIQTPVVQRTATTAMAFIQGGNSFGTTALLGTADSNSLSLITNNVARLTIDTSGNATLSGNLTVSGTGNSSFAGNVGIGITTPSVKLSLGNDVTQQKLAIYDGGSASTFYGFGLRAGYLDFQTAGTTHMTIDASGDVGIGNTAPAGLFSVGSSSQFQVSAVGNIQTSGTATISGLLSANGGLTVATGSTFTNASSTLNSALALGNFATGGAIGTAAATVDTHTAFTINQTTAGQTLTLPAPTVTTAGRIIYLANIGTTSFTINGAVVSSGTNATFLWNGSTWSATAVSTGVTLVGGIDTQTASANGAVINGNTIYLQSANGSTPGLVNGAAQTFAGAKTFSGGLISNTLNSSTGNLTISSTASGALTLNSNSVIQLSAPDIELSPGTNMNINGPTDFYSSRTTFHHTPTASATTSLIEIGSSIVGGNAAVNGGTYIGLNAPSTGPGSAADLMNLQSNGSTMFKVDRYGNLTITGNVTPLSGELYVDGIVTGLSLNGGSSNQFNVDTSGNLLTSGTGTIKTTSATAFSVQNASSTPLLNVDTSTGTITFGTGSNTVIFTASGGLVASGTAQHVRSINLSAEYAGAVLDPGTASGCSANNGTMTSGYDLTNNQNYYKWTTTAATNQCYDVVTQVKLPTDFNGWSGANFMTLSTYASTNALGTIRVDIIDPTTGTDDTNYNYVNATPATTNTWTTWTSSSSVTAAGDYTAGKVVTIRIRMNSPTNGEVRIGTLSLSYNSKY